jgi:hypothetical protein
MQFVLSHSGGGFYQIRSDGGVKSQAGEAMFQLAQMKRNIPKNFINFLGFDQTKRIKLQKLW